MNQQTQVIEGEVISATPKIDAAPMVKAANTASDPAALIRMAVEQNAPLDRLQMLMDLQDRFEAREARKAFVAAMAGFKRLPIEIIKRKQVRFTTAKGVTEYMHAELSDVTDAVGPALARHGLSHQWVITQSKEDNWITVRCTLTHESGHVEFVEMSGPPDDSAGKNDIQAIASTVSYLQRYTLLSICGIATKGQDDDGQGGRGDDGPRESEQPGLRGRKPVEPGPDQFPEFTKAMKQCQSLAELWTLWQSMPPVARSALSTLKEARKRTLAKAAVAAAEQETKQAAEKPAAEPQSKGADNGTAQ